MISQKQQLAFDQLSPQLKAFYSNPETAHFVLDCADKNNLDNNQKYKFAEYVGDIILGINTIDDLVPYLQSLEIGLYVATRIHQEIQNFIKKSTPTESVAVTNTPTTAVESVAPFRTMEMDAKKIHGYGAFRSAEPEVKEDQPVYRSEQAKLVSPPSYTDDSSTPKAS